MHKDGHILHQGTLEQLRNETFYLQGLQTQQRGNEGPKDQSTPFKAQQPPVLGAEEATDSSSQTLGEFATYGYYFGTVPKWNVILFVSLTLLYGTCFKMTELLLSFWTGESSTGQSTNNLYLSIYGILACFALLSITAAALFFLVQMVPMSSEVLHARLLQSVFGAPLSFFTRTDVGVTANRFSQDMSVIDTDLPLAFVDFTLTLGVLLLGAVLICVFSGYFAVIMLPIICFCWGKFRNYSSQYSTEF